MNHHFCFFPLVLGLAVVVSSPVNAAIRVSLDSTSLSELKQTFNVAVPGESVQQSVSTTNALRFVSQHLDANHMLHRRLQQEYLGFPVFGGFAISHHVTGASIKHTRSDSMSGVVYRDLKTDLGQPKTTFIAQASRALQQFKTQYANQTITDERVKPIVYVDEQAKAHWAYQVSLFIKSDKAIPKRPTAIIDADTQAILQQWNDIKTNYSPVKGTGYGGNKKTGAYQFGSDYPFLQMTRNNATSTCYMKNNRVKVVDMGHSYAGSTSSMHFKCDEPSTNDSTVFWTGYHANGYDEHNGAYSPTNDALYIGTVINDMYRSWYGVDVLMRDDKPMQLVMRVHYGQSFENAFWDGEEMTFGDGDTFLYPLVSMGVGAHEVSHGFTEQHSNLIYYGQSGGMNESFSDMAAQAAEFYSSGKTSWTIGHEIMKEGTGMEVLRYMDIPSRDGHSIDRANQFQNGMEVHYSSGVYNRLFYTLSNQPGWTVRQAFHVMLKANMDYWIPFSTFSEGACGVIRATNDLGFSDDAVKRSLDEVAINYDGCTG